jgi:hypothetical protein
MSTIICAIKKCWKKEGKNLCVLLWGVAKSAMFACKKQQLHREIIFLNNSFKICLRLSLSNTVKNIGCKNRQECFIFHPY